jgi:hypothetical protein
MSLLNNGIDNWIFIIFMQVLFNCMIEIIEAGYAENKTHIIPFTLTMICLPLSLYGCGSGRLTTSVTPDGGGNISSPLWLYSGKVTFVAAPAK